MDEPDQRACLEKSALQKASKEISHVFTSHAQGASRQQTRRNTLQS